MASNDTANLSELCVCLGIALIGRGYYPEDLKELMMPAGATIDHLYDLAEKMDISLTGRDWKYLQKHSGQLITDNSNRDRIRDRYIPTAILISDTVYRGCPPDPLSGDYSISGGENKRLEDGDPSDFIIGDENGYYDGFSLKDDSPALFGGSTTHLLEFISPELVEYMTDYDKAISAGKEFLQGKKIYTKGRKSLKQRLGYDWHLAAEEEYRNRAYEMCLQSLLDFFVRKRRAISRDAGMGFMLYNPDVPRDELPEIYDEYEYSDIPSEFMIWSWLDDVRAGARAGNRIPEDPRRWLAHFQPYNAHKRTGGEHVVIFDAYWADEYEGDTGRAFWTEPYDSEPNPMTFLGIFLGDANGIGAKDQIIIPLGEWWDEMYADGFESLGYLISVQGINMTSEHASYLEYDPEKDIEPILFSPDVYTDILWTDEGVSKPMTTGYRKVLHHLADYGCPDLPRGLKNGSRERQETAEYWMSRPFADWVDREYDEAAVDFFGDALYTQYEFWLQCIFFNSSRKLSDGINKKSINVADLDYEDQLWFLRFIFRIYENSYYYVNMHKNDTDILRVPSESELRDNGVKIRDATIPDAATVALRFTVGNYDNEECEININIIGGSGVAVFTDSPKCKISYTKGRNAGLRTVYDYVHCDEQPETTDQDLDAAAGIVS